MSKNPLYKLKIFLAGILVVISCKKDVRVESGTPNQPPISKAGADQIIIFPKDSILLDGSQSTDPGGRITAYKWSKIKGPVSSEIINEDSSKTIINKLGMGTYLFELIVTDNSRLSAKDTVQVIVDTPAFGQIPVACAGADQFITLPIDSVYLDGSCSVDPDNSITGYAWTKMSGPASFNLSSPNAAQTQATKLVLGIYQFELKVTDADGLFSRDTVQIIVSPIISAGCDNRNRPQIKAQLVAVGKLSQGRCGMAVASAGTKIVFAGASISEDRNSPNPAYGSSRVDIYDMAAQTWSTAELSEWRSDIAAVAAGNKIFFAGGRLGDGALDQLYSTVDIYDVSTNTWSVASLSQPRAYIAAASVGDKVFFAGGEMDWNYNTSDKVDIFDIVANSWSTAKLSENRAYISAVAANGKVYFAGGQTEDRWYSNPTKTIDIYDNLTGSWTTSLLIKPKAMCAGIAVANKIYWAGGDETGGYSNSCSVEIRDVNSQNSSIAYLHKPGGWVTAAGQNAVLKDNKIVLFRHYDNDASRFDIYDTTTDTWSIGVLPGNIRYASIISVNNNIYFAGGVVNGDFSNLSNQVWRVEF